MNSANYLREEGMKWKEEGKEGGRKKKIEEKLVGDLFILEVNIYAEAKGELENCHFAANFEEMLKPMIEKFWGNWLSHSQSITPQITYYKWKRARL